MKPVTVAIPTASQPVLLGRCLASIARQADVDRIEEIIVSENAGDPASEEVCREFSELPIRYVLRKPTLSLQEHFISVFEEARAEWIAFVCDDDWWAPSHIGCALGALETREAVAWFSASLFVDSDLAHSARIHRPTTLRLAAGNPSPRGLWSLRYPQVLAASAIQTPFHLSGMVVRRDVLQAAAPIMRDQHEYQMDRLLFVEIARMGLVLYEPMPDTYIRWDSGNLTRRHDHRDKERAFRRGSSDIWSMAARAGFDLEAEWRQYLGDLTPDDEPDVAAAFRRAMDDGALASRSFSRFREPARAKLVRRAARLLTRVSQRLSR